MEIVPVAEIPKPEDVIDTPTDDLMKLYRVCQDMKVVCLEVGGIGLAAVQVGMPWRLFVIRGQDGWEYMVNCQYLAVPVDITKTNPVATSIEGCLSLKDDQGKLIHYKVDRFKKVRVQGYRLIDQPELSLEEVDYVTEENIYNVVYQHEIDHQNGILISEIGEEIDIEPIVG